MGIECSFDVPLCNTREEEALKCVYSLSSSQEAWFSLTKKYNRVSATRKLDSQRRIQTITKQNKCMAVYLSEIKNFLQSVGLHKRSHISEHEKIYGVLNFVGKEYESICTVIKNTIDSYPDPCSEDVVFKLTIF